MAARTTTPRTTTPARKKATTTRKRTPRKKATGARALMGDELPKSLAAFSRQLKRDLTRIERQIVSARKETRRSLARIIRDASHQLGVLETRGQKEWRSLSRNARREIERVVGRVREALD